MPSRDAGLTAVRAAGAIVLTSVLYAPIAYAALFSTFAAYDDEGSLMMAVIEYAKGAALYDEVFVTYGPAHFQLVRGVLWLFGLPMTHDVSRLLVLVFWLATGALSAATVWRLTRTLTVALACQVSVLAVLIQMRQEPMHPGGLLCTLLALLALLATWLRVPGRPGVAALMGVTIGVAVWSKINVGTFALVSVAFALLSSARVDGAWRWLRLAATAAFVGVAVALMWPAWDEPAVRAYAWTVAGAAAMTAMIATAWGAAAAETLRPLRALVAAFVATSLVVGGIALATGTSPRGLLTGVLLAPLRFHDLFTIPLELPEQMMAWLAVAFVLCCGLTAARLSGSWDTAPVIALRGAVQLAAGLAMWAAFFAPPLSRAPYAVSLPLLWTALLGRAIDDPERRRATLVLVALAVLQSLHAYPAAGSQTVFGDFLFLPVAAVALSDGWRLLMGALARDARRTRVRTLAPIAGAAVGGILFAAVLRHGAWEPYRFWTARYAAGEPLALPGAERIRLPAEVARVYRAVTNTVRAECKSFVTRPGMYSFHVFAGMPPPTPVDVPSWMNFSSDAQQRAVVERLATAPAPLCLIDNHDLYEMWAKGRDYSARPLNAYLDARFTPLATVGRYVIRVRRDDGV